MTIRPLELEDLKWLQRQRNDWKLNEYFNQPHLINYVEEENWYKNNVVTGKSHSFVIEDSMSLNKKGYVSLRDINPIVRKAEFSIFVPTNYQHSGYGQSLIEFILKLGFERFNLNKIYSTVFQFNPAIDIYKNWGFQVDGIIRDDCYKNGKYHNSYYISMLKGEYERIYNSK